LNLGPTNLALEDAVQTRVEALRAAVPGNLLPFGLLGEPRVSVLKLNLTLDEMQQMEYNGSVMDEGQSRPSPPVGHASELQVSYAGRTQAP